MAIYRGTGGASDSTDDSTISAVTTQAGIATTKASEAASSATDANTSATNAAASATAASGHASTSSDNATASSGSATDAAGFATAASNSATAASTSATAAANSASIANSAEVQAVAAKTTEITGVYNDIANVNTVAGNIADVNTVATNSSNITAVAGDASDIGTVATSISNVNTVGDNIASVNAVASNNTNINTVAADASDIGTVAGISGNVTTVAGISSDVTTVAGLESKMDTVIADASDIGTVAGNIGDVSTVAGISSDVDTVAGISADVTSVADNMADVQNATTSATNAATSAASASDSASAASTSAGSASSSASSASTSATNATNSATAASNSATAASSSASAASGSESAASGSASAAASSASAASTSASNAATSETNAASSASAAATSATNAATSETNAAASATDSSNAASTWSNYYNTYVGASSSEPTVDVQGNALVAGALYFNTTNNTTYVWTGSAWNAVANNNIINPNVALTQDLATNGNDVKLGDNDKATFGAGDDLQIYHDGANSYISEVGAGDLVLKASSNLVMRGNTSNDILAVFSDGGASNLYYDNSPKLATTSTGIDVTGTATMDGLVVDSSAAAQIDLNDRNGTVSTIKQDYTALTLDADLNNTYPSSYARIRVDGVEGFRLSAGGDISFYEDTGTTPKLFWDASAESLGIGTSSPTQLLTLSSTDPRINLIDTNALANASTSLIQFEGSNGRAAYAGMISGDLYLHTDTLSAGDIVFRPNNSEAVRIDSSGNVGIGTDSPNVSGFNTALTVDGAESGIELTEGGTVQGIVSSNSKGLGLSGIGSRGIRLFTSASGAATERMRIDSSGNVGIGTSSPTSYADTTLHVSGSTGSTLKLSSDAQGNANTDGFDISHSGVTAFLNNRENGEMQFRTNNTERMRIDSSGRVGIGTSSPDTLMHLSGDATAILRLENTNAGLALNSVIGGIEFEKQDASGAGAGVAGSVTMISDSSNGAETALTFGTSSTARGNNAEAMRVSGTGNVGIGTSSPVSILHLTSTNDPTITLEDTGFGASATLKGSNGNMRIGSTTATLFDMGGSEVARFDSSGNLLVGTTNANNVSDGIRLKPDGFISAANTSGPVMYANRLSTDGSILSFQKDGATVGSIGSVAGGYTMYNSESGTGYLGVNGAATYAWDATKVYHNTDATGDLGLSNRRFKDAYLSGGVYLGGTGAANKLDDYEEGTWTPVLSNGATATNMTGIYTKVGRLVTVTFSLNNSTITGTPDYVITGLPFANGIKRASFPVVYHKTFNITCESIAGLIPASLSQMEFLGMIKGAGWIVANPTAGSGRYLHVTASYQTA